MFYTSFYKAYLCFYIFYIKNRYLRFYTFLYSLAMLLCILCKVYISMLLYILYIIIIIYLSWSWATCWPVPASRIQKSLQRSAMIPSASWCNSVSLPWVIYYRAFYLHVVSSFSCIPVICLKLVLFLIPFAICAFVL